MQSLESPTYTAPVNSVELRGQETGCEDREFNMCQEGLFSDPRVQLQLLPPHPELSPLCNAKEFSRGRSQTQSGPYSAYLTLLLGLPHWDRAEV